MNSKKTVPDKTPLDSETRATLLLGHYKDTSDIVQAQWKARNRIFMYVLLVMFVIAAGSIEIPSNSSGKSNEDAKTGAVSQQQGKDANSGDGRILSHMVRTYLKNKWNFDEKSIETLDKSDFGPMLDLIGRFLLLCVVIVYYQRSLLIDRLYGYLHHLEHQICELTGSNDICREGEAYHSREGIPKEEKELRPIFLRAVGFLYVYVFPTVLIALVVWKLFEQDHKAHDWMISILSVLCSLTIVVYSLMYMYWVKWRK